MCVLRDTLLVNVSFFFLLNPIYTYMCDSALISDCVSVTLLLNKGKCVSEMSSKFKKKKSEISQLFKGNIQLNKRCASRLVVSIVCSTLRAVRIFEYVTLSVCAYMGIVRIVGRLIIT